MQQIGIPCVAIRDSVRWGEFIDLLESFVFAYENNTGIAPSMFMVEPQPSDGFTSPFAISEAPEELIVATFSGDILQACYAALEIVATREPKITAQKSTRLKFKANFSMKRIFCQMTEIPITVFSMAMTADPTEAGLSPFFIRMPFTISEFKREIQRPM